MPLLWPVAGWLVGLASVHAVWPVSPIVFAGGAVFLLTAAFYWRGVAPFLSCLALGLLWMGWSEIGLDWMQRLDAAWLGDAVAVSGRVAEVQRTAFRQRLLLKDVRRDDGARLRGRVWCYLYGDRRIAGLLAGDRVYGRLRTHRPRNHHNPGGFDFVRYCRAHGVALLATPVAPLRIDHTASWLAQQRRLVRAALDSVGSATARAVLSALVLADRARIDDATWQRFSATGAAHLLAISGLHIGMVAAWGFGLVWWLLTRREAWIVNLSVRRCALLGGVLAALAYATLAGWTLPTQRAVLMLLAAAAAWWLRYQVEPLNSMLAALAVMLLWDPQAIASLSLWLSFVSVTALIVWGKRVEHGVEHGWRRWLRGSLGVTIVASLATLPLVVWAFGRFPLYAVPANLLLIPLYGFWVLPCALVGALLAISGFGAAAALSMQFAGEGVEVADSILGLFYGLPGGSWWVVPLPWWGIVALALLLVSALFAWWWSQRVLSSCLVVCALLLVVLWPERDVAHTQWTVWDVGQGAATTIRVSGGGVLAIDAPGRRGSRFNGGSTVADGLRAQGVTHLDAVAVSHLQSDHAGGVSSLLRRMNRVGEVWLADVPANRSSPLLVRWREILRRVGGRIRWVAQGDRLLLRGHTVRVLWPPRHASRSNPNNLSLVLSIELDDGRRMLAMGDSEYPVERALLRSGIGHHDVLIVPHHGSATSSSRAFLEQVHPDLALLQTGFGNRFHFPDPAVVARYRAVGATMLNSADGAILGEVQRGKISWHQMR